MAVTVILSQKIARFLWKVGPGSNYEDPSPDKLFASSMGMWFIAAIFSIFMNACIWMRTYMDVHVYVCTPYRQAVRPTDRPTDKPTDRTDRPTDGPTDRVFSQTVQERIPQSFFLRKEARVGDPGGLGQGRWGKGIHQFFAVNDRDFSSQEQSAFQA